MLSKSASKDKLPSDHVDAWLMSYADLITLLFMFFVIFVSISYTGKDDPLAMVRGEMPQDTREAKSGTLKMETPFENLYRNVNGVIAVHHADNIMSVQKSERGVWVEVSAGAFFERGSAEFSVRELPVLEAFAKTLKQANLPNLSIEVAGFTDDAPLIASRFYNNWELSSMRAARVVSLLAEQGINPDSMRATGYAGTRPVVPNRDVDGHAIEENQLRNQRVLIKLEKPPVPKHLLSL